MFFSHPQVGATTSRLMTVKSDVDPLATYNHVGTWGLARPWLSQVLLIVLCAASAIIARMAIDQFLPGASPFILIYPAITVATLLGSWEVGCATLAILFLYAWYVVVPLEHGFYLAI